MSTAPAYSIARRFQNLPEPSEVNPVGPAEYFVPAAFPAGPAFTVPQAPLVDTKTDDDTLPGVLHIGSFRYALIRVYVYICIP